MEEPIQFVKLSGSGNDFLCLDNRQGRFDPLLQDPRRIGPFARALCRRGMGVGADGAIFACAVEPGVDADIAARFLEADGSEAELCGNGTAVFIHWTTDARWFDKETGTVPRSAGGLSPFPQSPFFESREIRVLTQAGVVRGRDVDGQYVRVCIPLPHDMRAGERLRVGRREWEYDFVTTGVPHLVTYVPDVAALEVAHWGPLFRYHKRFAPRGVNANFVQVLGEGELAIRTYEFGVESETLACGTGCSAAAVLATLRFHWPEAIRRGEQPVLLHTHSGDVLRVYLTLEDDNSVRDLCLDTIVRFAYRGELHPQLVQEAMGPGGEG